MYKQHHVHIYNEETGEREPLTACRQKDNPKLCKLDFPRTQWMTDHAIVLCHGLLTKMGIPCSGGRNKLGGLHGPMNQADINGTHPGMLGSQRCNSDVQLPYRFPITAETHCCDEDCVRKASEADITRSCQISQDARGICLRLLYQTATNGIQ